jgi:hypothetical protein
MGSGVQPSKSSAARRQVDDRLSLTISKAMEKPTTASPDKNLRKKTKEKIFIQ